MRPHCSHCASGQDVLHLQDHGFVQGGNGQSQAFHRLETPPELAEAYRQMLAIAKPKRAPRLLCRDVVGGAAGRWFSLGVIVLGLSEIDALADKLWWKLSLDQRWAGSVPDQARLRDLARLFILAHELGHELTHEGRRSRHDGNIEAAADFWAGCMITKLLGCHQAIGEAFFALIGCNEKFCTHPSSDRRSQAFSDGFRSGVAATEQSIPRPAASDQAWARRASPSYQRRGPSPGEVVAGIVGVVGLTGLVLGALKLLGMLDDKTYDSDVDRYRNRRGQFTRG